MVSKFWYVIIIAVDIFLTNANHFFDNASAEMQWHIWDITQATRVCFIPLVMLLQKKLDKWGELITVNYLTFSFLDLIQTVQEKNTGIQVEEFVSFIVVTFIMTLRWKQTP